jgi:hypothetical protein
MSEKRKGVFMVAIYSHPEYYPPTLNAIDQLSEIAESIIVITRNNKFSSWDFPENVELYVTGEFVSIRESEGESTIWKVQSFLRFTWTMFQLYRKRKPDWVVCYDSIPLFSAGILKRFARSGFKLWYHNHDVSEVGAMRKYSIGWFAARSEQTIFKKVDLFTLPSRERTGSFNLREFTGSLFVIPNYPSIRRYKTAGAGRQLSSGVFRMIFQGFISSGHGLEEVIEFVSAKESVHLTIIGPGDRDYVKKLKDLVLEKELSEKIFIRDVIPYHLLIKVTQLHDLGLAIHKPVNIQYRTGALASNKIYEYAACGLPVMYYNETHYRNYLSRFPWAFANDLSYERLDEQYNFIREHYNEISAAAADDFRKELNFEHVFCPVRDYLLKDTE